MVFFSAVSKSLGNGWLKSKPDPSYLFFTLNKFNSQGWQFQSIRTLLLQSRSDSVKLQRLTDSNSGEPL